MLRSFGAAVPLPKGHIYRPRVERLLAHIERARTNSKAVDAAWERVFFQGDPADESERVAIEVARIKARHDLNWLRWTLRFSAHLPHCARIARFCVILLQIVTISCESNER